MRYLFLLLLVSCSVEHSCDHSTNSAIKWSVTREWGIPPEDAEKCARCIQDYMGSAKTTWSTSIQQLSRNAEQTCNGIYTREYMVLRHYGVPVPIETHQAILDSLLQ